MGNAAHLFWNTNAERECLTRRITPSQSDLEYLQESWNPLGDHLRSELSKLWEGGVSSWLQGSYKFGTLLQPLHPDDEYDVDMGIYLEYRSTNEAALPSPHNLKLKVHELLTGYERITPDAVSVPDEKQRCSRIIFQNNFHVDVPSYKLCRELDDRKLATKSDDWEDSDPKAIYVWFRSCVPAEQNAKLRRLIRYAKAWARLNFHRLAGSQPTSIMLTVLIAEAFQSNSQAASAPDDESLTIVIREVMARVSASSEVPNPVNATEDLNRMSSTEFQEFVEKLKEFLSNAEEALQKPTALLAAIKWAECFKHFFPLPDDEDIPAEQYAVMIPSPNIRIHAMDRRTKEALGTFENAVPRIQANADLTFTITNPEFIPSDAQIEWTVRNTDEHAAEEHDLGHSTYDGGITNTEHTKYRGKHYMDCLIWRNGQVIAMRRVPVTVQTKWAPRPLRNPPRPAWTRLRKGARR